MSLISFASAKQQQPFLPSRHSFLYDNYYRDIHELLVVDEPMTSMVMNIVLMKKKRKFEEIFCILRWIINLPHVQQSR